MSSKEARQQLLALSWTKKALTLSYVVFVFPLAFLWKLAKSPVQLRGYPKPWRRKIREILLQAIRDGLDVTQMRFLLKGNTKTAYEAWAKSKDVDPREDVIAHGGRILWVGKGPKDSEEDSKVVLYFHGGGYLLPMQEWSLDYWSTAIKVLEKSKKHVSVAALAYNLSGESTYPVQLNQALAAIEHLLKVGYKPSNIVLAGDSAGANLVFQVLLHLNLLRLRSTSSASDVDVAETGVATFELPADLKLRGALGISPWFPVHSKKAAAKSYQENRGSDIISPEALRDFARIYAAGVPESHKPHFDFTTTPKEWFKGLDGVVDRILITVGEKELLRDDILEVARGKVAEYHPDTTIILQEFGVHDDVFYDAAAGLDPLTTKLTLEILEWLEAVLNQGTLGRWPRLLSLKRDKASHSD
ncbi:hypothetical protein EST38_g3797 [Candolleomyces aberdarensis]|uniref:Alpha/beta hydrolase fold-3 domain-containing protein n=1 Tax=Candolleomyces aberdarensis TaxID=2316362 RepID=A0A4Q2DSN3_9AGAR|nr:hypothetical protein EST38_g3797 [Candolleomyces aberdarensis]